MGNRDFSFLHAADLHLDSPFEGLSQVNDRLREFLRDASLRAFDSLVELSIQKGVSFVLLAGDIYDGPERGVRAQFRFKKGVERLSERGIGVFIVHGNHDPLGGWTAIRQWPPGVKVFGTQRVEQEKVALEGEIIATIYGISYGKKEVKENLVKRFKRKEGPGLHIGLLHCNVGSNSDHAQYSPCSPQDLKESGLDYWALGHVHKGGIVLSDEVWAVYPGCLQGRSLKPSEQGVKGAALVTVKGGKVSKVENIPLDKVRFLTLRMDVSDVEDATGLCSELLKRGDELLSENEGRSLVVKAILEGKGKVAEDLKRQGVMEQTLDTLRERHSEEEPFLWWEEIVDQTSLPVDLEDIRKRGDLSSDLVALSEKLFEDSEGFKEFAKRHFLDDLPLRDLRKIFPSDRLFDCEEELTEDLLKARDRAIELLERGSEG